MNRSRKLKAPLDAPIDRPGLIISGLRCITVSADQIVVGNRSLLHVLVAVVIIATMYALVPRVKESIRAIPAQGNRMVTVTPFAAQQDLK